MSNLKYTILKYVPSSWRRAELWSETTFYLAQRTMPLFFDSAFPFCPILDFIAKLVCTFIFVHLSICCTPSQITVSFASPNLVPIVVMKIPLFK